MIRIGIVDDHYILLDGIKKLIEYNEILTVVFQAESGKECLEFLEKAGNTIDVLLLDICMPEINGFDVLKKVKKKYLHIKTIFLTSYDDYVSLSCALSLGVEGYLLKKNNFNELIYAINEVNKGLIYVDKSLTHLLKQFVNTERVTLTKREQQIMVCVASGMMNKEIALDLKIREETVKNHLSKIFYKFHVNDRTQAVVYAVKHHYIEL